MKKWPGHHRRSPLAVAIYDGRAWFIFAMRRGGGEWRVHAQAENESRNGRQLPRSLLDAAVEAGARRLRLLLTGDPHVLSIEAHDELSPEELHAALLYEAKGELGVDADGLRFAAGQTSRYDMGAGRHDVLAAGFDLERIERFTGDAARAWLAFEAVGALESALLHRHATQTPDRRLLLIREHTSFYVVPAGDMQPFLVATLPLGLEAVHDTVAKERAERAGERLATHRALPLSVVLASHEPSAYRAGLEPFLGGAADYVVTALTEAMPEMATLAAQGRAGGFDSPCGLIGLPPPPRDPHRHGTVMFFLILLLTLGWIGFQRQNLSRELARSQARVQDLGAVAIGTRVDARRNRAPAQSAGCQTGAGASAR